jgi:mono/diheme cytochrome c family protein
MPSFAGVLDDGEVQSLIAYIRAQGSGQGVQK